MNNSNPYGASYGQNSCPQEGTTGISLQMQNKAALRNVSEFSLEKKPGTSLTNMVSITELVEETYSGEMRGLLLLTSPLKTKKY